MDNTIKIGLGGVFLGTALGFVPWLWPTMPRTLAQVGFGLFVAGAAWGMWPVLKHLFSGGGLISVSMSEATRIAYENSERNLVGQAAYRMGRTQRATLSYFFRAFVDKDVPIYGAKPPSTRSRRIPTRDLMRLQLLGDLNSAAFHGKSQPTYTNLHITRWHLFKAVRHLRRQPDSWPRMDARDP